MKRIIAAVSLALLAAPVLAAETGLPFEQTQFDRGVYNVEKAEQNASAGASSFATGVWAQDHNFIAPAQ